MKVTSFDRFWDDLKSEDRNPEDNITKLAVDEGLNLVGKVVVIQGVDETKTLPETVAGYKQWKNFQTLPIVCGVFAPYTEEPGAIYDEGSLPGPVASVEEGQDHPAELGEGEDPGTGGVIISGPTNEAGSNDSPGTSNGSEEDDSDGTESNSNEPRPDTIPRPRPEPESEPETRPEPIPEPDEDEGICWPWENGCHSS